MTFRIALFLLFLTGTSLALSAQSKFPYEEYRPRTLSEIIELDSDVKDKDVTLTKEKMGQLVLHANFLYSHVRVKFLNKSRPISTERKTVIDLWRGTFGVDEKAIALFENEYLFRECNNEYWIPVQKQVAAYFPKELKEGDMITLYLMRVGGKKPKDGEWDWIFLVNEFNKN